MEPIIAINFIKKQLNPNCSSQELIKNLIPKFTKFLICPKNFEDLKEKFRSLFEPRNREKEKLFLSYNGFLASGERVEITDDKTFNKNISLFFVCYTKEKKDKKSLKIPNINTDNLFQSENIEIQPESEEIENFNINDFIKLRNSVSTEISNKKMDLAKSFIENVNTSFNEQLAQSVKDVMLQFSQKNIEKNANDLRKSFQSSKNLLFERKNSISDTNKKANKKIKDMNIKIQNNNSGKLINKEPNKEDLKKEEYKKQEPKKEEPKKEKLKKEEHKKEEPKKDKPEEEEKIIFKFKRDLKELTEKINYKDKKAIIKIKDIEIKNISKKEYKSSLMSWIREDKSDEKVYFSQDNEEIKQLPFQIEKNISSQEEINDLFLDVIVNEVKDEVSNYKIFISIINKENKKVISEKPLEIVIKIEKVISKEEVDTILQNLKNEIEDINIFFKDDDLISIIKNKKKENEIKKMVKEKFDIKKNMKIDELLRTLREETNFSQFLDDSEVKNKIESSHFSKNEVKEWINSQKPAPSPNPPNPNPLGGSVNEQLIEEYYQKLENELYISSLITVDEFRENVIKYNYDFEKISVWAKNLF